MSSSSVIIISVSSTQMFELDFDLLCCHTNECLQCHKVFAHYEEELCLKLFTLLRGLDRDVGFIIFPSAKGGIIERGLNR